MVNLQHLLCQLSTEKVLLPRYSFCHSKPSYLYCICVQFSFIQTIPKTLVLCVIAKFVLWHLIYITICVYQY
jgi:hypothetical protein